jgi:diguanylate cyclase (GGDEF)-like protein/PAS domain S-box-containing protein
MLVTDADNNIIDVNPAFTRITGYAYGEVIGKNPRVFQSGMHDDAFYREMWADLSENDYWQGEIWDRRKSGETYPKLLTINTIRDESGNTVRHVALFSDISEKKKSEEMIWRQANFDVLTGLPNRRLLMDRLASALSLSARNANYGALLFIDMDKFKMLNDTLGHDYGDLLLVEVAARACACVREVDTVARFGGDEFVILIEEVDVKEELASHKISQIAEKIREALAQPYRLKSIEYHSSPSIGVSLYRGNELTVDQVMKHSDLAMYQAKDSGRNTVRFFDPEIQRSVENRVIIEADLRRAVAEQQLCLYYQIQVDNHHRPLGAEALVRWMHPVRGMVSPAQFIPVAEESSLIIEIGHWVLITACEQLALWAKDEITRGLMLAVNVSAKQFRQQDFVAQVGNALRDYGVIPNRLKLELTESVVLNDVTDVVAKMYALKALGVRLSLDDFGTGYSSLAYLKNLPLDQIKIDQSFVRGVATDQNDAVMVKTIIDLAHNFRLNVIAEGVETQSQLEFLKQNNCMSYQGYLFSKPVPIVQFEGLLRQGALDFSRE